MSTVAFEKDAQSCHRDRSPVLELLVNNHPGVMSHICGLFARRAFNVEKILCLPCGSGEQSRIWLTINHAHRLDQIMKQAMKLEDVLEVQIAGTDREVFGRIEALIEEKEGRLQRENETQISNREPAKKPDSL